MNQRFQVLEVSDARDFCECCGKTGLKRVVFIRDVELDEVKHFGTTCATAPSKGFGLDREVKAAIGRHDSYLKCLNNITHGMYRKLGGRYEAKGEGCWRAADSALFDSAKRDAIARGFNF